MTLFRILCACLLICLAWGPAPSCAAQVGATRSRILDQIAEIKRTADRELRLTRSEGLANSIRITMQASNAAVIDQTVLRGLGELLDEPEDRFWIAAAIGQIGPKASVLTPELMSALADEERQEQARLAREGVLISQPVDSIDTICVALQKIGSDLPAICVKRFAR